MPQGIVIFRIGHLSNRSLVALRLILRIGFGKIDAFEPAVIFRCRSGLRVLLAVHLAAKQIKQLALERFVMRRRGLLLLLGLSLDKRPLLGLRRFMLSMV